jgi:hypothetical protein
MGIHNIVLVLLRSTSLTQTGCGADTSPCSAEVKATVALPPLSNTPSWHELKYRDFTLFNIFIYLIICFDWRI